MADDKKGGDKGKKPEAASTSLVLDGLLILLIIIFFLFSVVPYLLKGIGIQGISLGDVTSSVTAFAVSLFTSIQFISIFLSLLFIMAIIYINFMSGRRHHLEMLKENEKVNELEKVRNAPATNPKWTKVLSHLNSVSEGDWRLAIIEADIILGDMLEKMGYVGDGIGEKLKKVEKSDFATIDNAWEAHKIRNVIAHEGSDYELSQREARRVIDLYRSVFEEFYFI